MKDIEAGGTTTILVVATPFAIWHILEKNIEEEISFEKMIWAICYC